MSQDRTKKNRLGKTYALALYDFARSNKNIDVIANDLTALNEAYNTSTELKNIVSSPLISKAELASLVDAIQKKFKFSKDFQNFCHLLIENRRLSLIPEITEAYKNHLSQQRGEQNIIIRSAIPLKKKRLDEITQLVDNYTQKKSSVETTVDEALLGGFVVEIGSKMIDASLSNQLQRLQHHLKSINT